MMREREGRSRHRQPGTDDNLAPTTLGSGTEREQISMSRLTHLDERGEAHMVDVSAKAETSRVAVAEGFVAMATTTLALITGGTAKKGDVLATARIAGIMAAKRTHELIPLCHPLLLTSVKLELAPEAAPRAGVRVTATVKVRGQTGVEMEALTAVSVACLTVYDMVKAVDRGMTIGDVGLVEKTGGKSGTWRREAAAGSAPEGE